MHRHTLSINPLKPQNNFFKYFFFPRTIVERNALMNEAVTQHSMSAFENHL